MKTRKAQQYPINWVRYDQRAIVLAAKVLYKDGMFSREVQAESRVRENFKPGLIGKVKPMRLQCRGFTLIDFSW